MLASEYRLRHEKDIKTLMTRGKSVFGLLVGMKFRPNRLAHPRFAVVAGLKVSKRAVDRNRLKRQVRAIIQEVLPQLKPGYDVLLFLKKEALGKEFDVLKKQILASLKKANLL